MANVGCKLHSDRTYPKSCHFFYCSWLASQRLNGCNRMPPEMRPDRCHVVFGPIDEKIRNKMSVNVDPNHPDAWREPEVVRWLTRLVANGNELQLIIGNDSATLRIGCRTIMIR